jgi:hypothetical protein
MVDRDEPAAQRSYMLPQSPIRNVLFASVVIAATAAASACGAGESAATVSPSTAILGAVEEIPSPAPAGSKTPFVITDDSGSAYLSWTEQRADSSFAIRLAKWNGATWDSSRTVAADRPFFVNWADFPAIVKLGNGDLAAHWLEREGTSTYAYGIRTVRSRDDGRTWSAPVTPHTDGLAAEHGFVSLWAEGGRNGSDSIFLLAGKGSARNFGSWPSEELAYGQRHEHRHDQVSR